jgi:hypothetical protein
MPCTFKYNLLLSQTYPQWNLASNVIPGTATVANGTESLEVASNTPKKMKIPKRLSTIRKIKDLRELLMSLRLYLNNEACTTLGVLHIYGYSVPNKRVQLILDVTGLCPLGTHHHF